MLDYKYIEFLEHHFTGNTYVWMIIAKNSGDIIGHIKWYAPWRQYCFEAEPDCVFNRTCLNDIVSFINLQMANRKL